MLLPVPGVLKPDELTLVRATLAGVPDLERLNRLVMGDLTRHPVYRGGALPLHAASAWWRSPANRPGCAGNRARECGALEPDSHVDRPVRRVQ